MAQKELNTLLVTEEARFTFPHLFEPKPIMKNGQPQGDPIYSVQLLFSPEDIKPVKKAAAELAQQRWPGRNLKELNFPFKNGETEAARQAELGRDGEFYRGFVLLKASSKYAPGVVGPDKQYIIDEKQIYSGMWGRVQINLKTYVSGTNAGVKAYLNHVMKTADDERLFGTTAKDAFAGVTTNVDPTAGADDDDIPF